MKKVLVLGAGLVAKPLVQYLLRRNEAKVVVADRIENKAAAVIGGAANGNAVTVDISEAAALDRLVADCDLAVSLLPAPDHPLVADACIRHAKHLVTTSYVGPKMAAFDKPARDLGVVFLNEVGLDPGLDHMSAMKVIHAERRNGAVVTGFRSYCGGLPAPEANNNPWGYKFSWSPRGVVAAAKNSAVYLKDGREVRVPSADLFTDVHMLEFDGIGTLEAYPNRDSLSYIESYGLKGIKTMYRGTLRYPGWCALWKKIADLGLLDETKQHDLAGVTYAAWLRGVAGAEGALGEAPARMLKLSADAGPIRKLEWLGLFGETPIPLEKAANLDILAGRLLEKLSYATGERDMIAMRHIFDFAGRGGRPGYRITSTLIDFGEPKGDSAMSRTVGLPAAIAATLILGGKIKATGVKIPVEPEIFEPVLKELENVGVEFTETRQSL